MRKILLTLWSPMPPGTSLSVFLLTETIFHAWLPKQVPLSPQHGSSSAPLSIQPLPIHSTYIQAVLLPGKEEFKLLVFYVLQKWDSKNTRCIMAPDCFMLECHCNSSSSPISATSQQNPKLHKSHRAAKEKRSLSTYFHKHQTGYKNRKILRECFDWVRPWKL